MLELMLGLAFGMIIGMIATLTYLHYNGLRIKFERVEESG